MLVMQRSETGEPNARRRRLSDLNCTSKCGDDRKYRNFKVENAGRLGKTGKSPLEELKTQLKELSDWGPDAVVAAVAGYQRFLQLKVSAADHEAVKVSPPPVIDFVWCTHMRYVNNYNTYCFSLAGRTIPYSSDSSLHSATTAAYSEVFKEPAPDPVWSFDPYEYFKNPLASRYGIQTGITEVDSFYKLVRSFGGIRTLNPAEGGSRTVCDEAVHSPL